MKSSIRSRVIAVITLYGVLFTSLWAAAGNKQCILGQKGCQGGGQYYYQMQTSNTSLTNITYQKMRPSKAQMLAGAAQIMAYANQELNNGDIAVAQAQFLTYLNNGTFYTTQLNATRGYQTMVTFGGIVPQASLQGEMNKTTMAERQYAAAYIQQHGLYAFLSQLASTLTYLANTYGLGVHPHIDPFTASPARIFIDSVIIVGTILALGTGTAEALGLGMLLGAAIGTYFLDQIE